METAVKSCCWNPSSLLFLAVTLQLIYSAAAQCGGLCRADQFCSVHSIVARCIDCDESCESSCSAEGPRGCDSCKKGYMMSAGYCKACPDYQFGVGCSGTCHCESSNPRCRPEDGYCYSYECAQGYHTKPYCQHECAEGFFHSNCELLCHCPDGDTCDKVNGACSSKSCHAEWGGSGCQIRLPRLEDPPVVSDIMCDSMLITWPRWRETLDIGEEEGMIAQYDLYMDIKNSTRGWRLVRTMDHLNTSSMYKTPLPGLIQGWEYRFRVDVRRYSKGDMNKLMLATDGVSTDYILADCPGPHLIDRVSMVLDENGTLVVTWKILNSTANSDVNITIEYIATHIGDCQLLNKNQTTLIDVDNTGSYQLTTLSPWRQYLVRLTASSEETNITNFRQTSIVTAETVPTGTVGNVTVSGVSSNRANVNWGRPQCEDQGGRLWKYRVSVHTVGGSTTDISYTVLPSSLTQAIEGLSPYTNYTVKVQFVTRFGSSPFTEEVPFTTKEAAPGKPQIEEIHSSEMTLEVTVSPPNVTNGLLTNYMMSVGKDEEFSHPVSMEYLANTTKLVMRNLSPYTVYFVRVRVRTSAGWSNYSDYMELQTKQDYPSEPAQISSVPVFKNETCLEISWLEPETKNGIIHGYKIEYFPLSETVNKNAIEVNSTENMTLMICSLLPGQNYEFNVAAGTSKGYGQSVSRYFFTEVGTPIAPPKPTFISSTYTTMDIYLHPVILNSGPLTAYHLIVEEIEESGRKKREATNITSTGNVTSEYIAAKFPGDAIVKQLLFKVGDDKRYGGYSNIPLKHEHLYYIHFEVVSALEGIKKFSRSTMDGPTRTVITSTPAPAVQSTEADTNGIIIGVVLVFIILALALLIILGVWLYRRKHLSNYIPYVNEKHNSSLSFYEEGHDPEKYWSKIHSLQETRHITDGSNNEKPQTMTGMPFLDQSTPYVSFVQEFSNLPHNQQATRDAAENRRNIHKNRFPHLLAYDHSRVILKADDDSTSDYINASFISGYKSRRYYIAAQSPFDAETVLDFWRMIYQYNIKTVVMMGNLVEDNIVKCTQYWPEKKMAKYRSFIIENVEIQEFADYVIRKVRLKIEGAQKGQLVYIFEYVSWPEHGVPTDPLPLLQMRHKVRERHSKIHSPLLVHCGTGVSRSATYIAIDSLIEQYNTEGNVSVFNFVRKLRKDRIAMVRTQKQYIFIYEAVLDGCVIKNAHLGFDLKNKYHTLLKKDPKTGHSHLKDQFMIVQKYNRKILSSECITAMLAKNQQRNRFLEILPPDHLLPLLYSMDTEKNSYINAVFVNSHRKRNYFIVTQSPLHTTVTDFWKLVYDYNVNTIVMMENFRNEDDTCAEYWPLERLQQYEPFFVEPKSVSQEENVTIRQFQIWNRNHAKDKRVVRQFQFNAWSGVDFVPRSKSMVLDLIELVLEWQCSINGDRSPIIVHCKDGATHSGLFCAVHIICESMRDDKSVDISWVIRHLKRCRMQIVDVLEQYRFCYKILWDYMNLRMPGGPLTDRMTGSKTDDGFGMRSLNLTSQSPLPKFV
ncbi:hypothetical protein ScPMuIL_009983 [Solemya velum]